MPGAPTCAPGHLCVSLGAVTGFLSHMLGTTRLFCFPFILGEANELKFFLIFFHIISKMGELPVLLQPALSHRTRLFLVFSYFLAVLGNQTM